MLSYTVPIVLPYRVPIVLPYTVPIVLPCTVPIVLPYTVPIVLPYAVSKPRGRPVYNPKTLGPSHAFRIPEAQNHERSQCFELPCPKTLGPLMVFASQRLKTMRGPNVLRVQELKTMQGPNKTNKTNVFRVSGVRAWRPTKTLVLLGPSMVLSS